MTRASKTLASSLLFAVSLVAMLGCASAGSTLDGTQWKLTGWTLSSLAASDFAISAKFAGWQISGNGGVNSYSGRYEVGPGDSFSVGPLASTRMAGPEPAMRAESGYMQLLEQAKSYKLADGKLTLYDAGGNESLSFEAASDSGSLSAPSAARCVAVADQCQLPEGPLGVCERSACAAGETPPCFKCTPQH